MERKFLFALIATGSVLLAASGGLAYAFGDLLLPSAKHPKGDAKPVFGSPLVIDQNHLAGEPNLRIDLKGRLYVGAPCGFVGCNQGWFWRSMDGGNTWEFIHHVDVDGSSTHNREWRLSVAPGGGDSDIAVTPRGRIYYADLYLAEISVSSSDDMGLTWTRSNPAVSNVPLDDRQWISAFGENMVYVAFNQIPYGPMITKSIDGGVTWTTLPAVDPSFIDKWGTIGNILTNQRDGRLVVPFTACNDDGECYNDVWVTVSRDGGFSWTQHKVHAGVGDATSIFPAIAQDHDGNLYLTWSEQEPDTGERNTFVATSTDWGANWSKPMMVSAGVTNSVLPWIASGSPGRAGVVFYGTDHEGDAQAMPGEATWHVYYAHSANALDSNAEWTLVRATEKPNHHGGICLGGLGCTGAGDRSLLDFFQVQVDPFGMANIIYADNADTCGPKEPRPCPDPFVTFIKQTSGPSLVATPDLGLGRDNPGRAPDRDNRGQAPGTVEWATSDEFRDGLLTGRTAERVGERMTHAAEESAEELEGFLGVPEPAKSVPAVVPAPPAAPASWWERLLGALSR